MDPKPATVDVREGVERYPKDPKPATVDFNPEELIKSFVANPIIVDVSSVGSINELILLLSPATVEIRLVVDT
jgi:hypothetical protein